MLLIHLVFLLAIGGFFLIQSRIRKSIFLDPMFYCVTLVFIVGLLVADLLHHCGVLSSPNHLLWFNHEVYRYEFLKYALFCFICLCVGYFFGSKSKMSSSERLVPLMKDNIDMFIAIFAIVSIVSILSRIYMFDLEVFGYFSSMANLDKFKNSKQLFDLIGQGGKLSLVLLIWMYYRVIENRLPRYRSSILSLICTIFVIEILFCFLSGFKGSFFILFGLCVVTYYSAAKKIPSLYSILVGSLILFATLIAPRAVIDGFRSAYNDESLGRANNVMEVFDLLDVSKGADNLLEVGQDTAIYFVKRVDQNLFGRIGLLSGAEIDEEKKVEFQKRIYLALPYALVPRVFWNSKPGSTLGSWFREDVLLIDGIKSTSIGMTPFSFSFFAFGTFGPLVFLIIGSMIGVWARLIEDNSELALLFLPVGANLVLIDSDIGGIFVTFIRYLFLVILGYLFLRLFFKKIRS